MADNAKAKRKSTKKTNNDLQTLHRKQKIEQHEPHCKPGMDSGVPGVLPLLQTRWQVMNEDWISFVHLVYKHWSRRIVVQVWTYAIHFYIVNANMLSVYININKICNIYGNPNG